MKFQIQQRQWRHFHIDAHYAAAYFRFAHYNTIIPSCIIYFKLLRYMREYAVLVREHCHFFSVDDKHKIKVGEPDCPVASAERGRRVPVRSDETFVVADHDFTKFGVIPSFHLSY